VQSDALRHETSEGKGTPGLGNDADAQVEPFQWAAKAVITRKSFSE
jgi:hypothetical protein